MSLDSKLNAIFEPIVKETKLEVRKPKKLHFTPIKSWRLQKSKWFVTHDQDSLRPGLLKIEFECQKGQFIGLR